MKKLLLIFTLLVSTVMFSSPSYAKWTKLGENDIGNTYYVDFERIKKHDGYVYWWVLVVSLKPGKDGTLSVKAYHLGDCKLFRFKVLSDSYYKESMGGGTPSTSSNKPDKDWRYPSPNTPGETILKMVCSR